MRDWLMRQVPPVTAFAGVALAPALLLIWGATGGGGWPLWAGFLWMAIAAPLADTLIARGFGDARPGARFPGADLLLVVLAAVHLGLMLAALGGFAGDGLGWPARIALFLGAGMWFGQVANSTAHELIHRGDRRLFRLGAGIYVSLLFGHHVSAHRLVHHIHVATPEDPNSARSGESFWRFLPRAWTGSFREGWRAEARRARQSGRANPYLYWVSGAAGCILLAFALFGARAGLDYILLCLYA
ncbi:MAG: fatty acid desaturase, partial [Paracoccus sp. (in: a-proteobacteria)]|nr:fatty acid desaturase [Paracoccus sp. (in: a-proteobacteria)]